MGVQLVATAHADSFETLLRNPHLCAFWGLDLVPKSYGRSLHLAVVGADELVRVSIRFRQGKTSSVQNGIWC
jgi:stage III sporulation protein SpoIIIAA